MGDIKPARWLFKSTWPTSVCVYNLPAAHLNKIWALKVRFSVLKDLWLYDNNDSNHGNRCRHGRH